MNKREPNFDSRQTSKSSILIRSIGDTSTGCVAIFAGQIGPPSIGHHGPPKASVGVIRRRIISLEVERAVRPGNWQAMLRKS
ncbi:hypothetical protein RMSM_02933 [Rhodopirellula maiorica SM1]|uniref:Uncharacterized protein n=1 Tax=Rhodopirellula maiorica SM1 TaxID=1265738 RepID=M5RLF2_9BACT|nr:hypothetical protein RMSM_02933 [Rhodopirellula maiorica SM1]